MAMIGGVIRQLFWLTSTVYVFNTMVYCAKISFIGTSESGFGVRASVPHGGLRPLRPKSVQHAPGGVRPTWGETEVKGEVSRVG